MSTKKITQVDRSIFFQFDSSIVIVLHRLGWTPLHEGKLNLIFIKNRILISVFSAVTKNQYRAASLLLKSGANANALGPEGQTPLIDAVLNNNIKVHFDSKKKELIISY